MSPTNPTSTHPADPVLLEWLDATAGDDVASHIEGCDVCADRLEALLGEDHLDEALELLLAPPIGLEKRVTSKVQRRLSGRADMDLFTDLLGIGSATVKLIMDPEGPQGEGDA